jgi:aerobic-type carbon monoxide dehydrogenase small subunit (CoxS/CutS family)
MATYNLTVNKKAYTVEAEPDMPLLWVLRDLLNLTGTKYGCGIAQCGACTIHLEGRANRACVLPVAAVQGRAITTIEGLSDKGDHPLQLAWKQHDVPQCGYCQAGQLMSAAALLAEKPSPTDAEINAAMNGNICRCATYNHIKDAIKTASGQ